MPTFINILAEYSYQHHYIINMIDQNGGHRTQTQAINIKYIGSNHTVDFRCIRFWEIDCQFYIT